MLQTVEQSRSPSPASFLTNSFHNANSTIDDLTLALANFSRVSSPEPPTQLTCCCGSDGCANLKAWLELKSGLESRLILSAEVGQALLQRHEAYVRQHEKHKQSHLSVDTESETIDNASAAQISELLQEKAMLEKRLNQALVNNEITEVSTKTIMHELQEARSTISRLTSHHARSLGWETRLSSAIREKDDMQQERDGESNRAKIAENRLSVMMDKTTKLQAEVRRLQDTLEERRSHRMESSEHILQDARLRLETLQNSQLGQTALVEQNELTNVLESLVGDNEALKRDNTELQNMLLDSREETYSLKEELEELRAKPPSRTGAGTPQLRNIYVGSVPGSATKDYSLRHYSPRSASVDRRYRRPFEPLTPETSLRPLSPAEPLTPSEIRGPSFNHPRPRYSSRSSRVSIEVEESTGNDGDPSSPEKPKTHKTLLLLTRSRAVQTEPWRGFLSPSSLIPSPHDPRSECSSFSDTLSSHLSVLLDRFSGLANRISQADALTLTNRLKRQHLKGADVRHLSRSTVNNIITEANNIRLQFRFLLEDDSVVVPCTRKDFRMLFKLLKDLFTEAGEMRVALNDIILDPSCASGVSELALNPNKAEDARKEKEREAAGIAPASSWMAPISKLFSHTSRSENPAERPGLSTSISGQSITRPVRFVPKIRPALSASATTVNVEFSGMGVGRSITSTVASQTKRNDVEVSVPPGPSTVMNIFAGAPQNTTPDPWVIVPKGLQRQPSGMKLRGDFSSATIRRSTMMNYTKKMSRDVDAVIDVGRSNRDDEESDDVPPLLQRTLRRRGLSDTSIHSTFTSQGEEPPAESSDAINHAVWPDRRSVFQALSKTVETIRNTATGTASEVVEGPVAIAPSPRQHRSSRQADATGSSGLRNLLPNLSSWAAAGDMLEPTPDPFLMGSSVRDESFMQQRRRTAGERHHDHEYL